MNSIPIQKQSNIERNIVGIEYWEYLALLLTDGYISRNRNSFEIGFINNSPVLLEKFKQLTQKLCQKTPKLRKSISGTPGLRFYSKDIGEKLLELKKTFKNSR